FTFSSFFLCISIIYPSSADIYTLYLHDALPISAVFFLSVLYVACDNDPAPRGGVKVEFDNIAGNKNLVLNGVTYTNASGENFTVDRKSTRLNSSHVKISYAVFCLKKKNNK